MFVEYFAGRKSSMDLFRAGLMVVAVAALLCAGQAYAADAEEAAAEEAPAKPDTHVVKAGLFKIKTTIDGVFEAHGMTEVSIEPEAWNNLVMSSVVDHGETVAEGDVLIVLDTTDLDEAIADVEAGMALADLNFRQAKEELARLEVTTPLDIAKTKRDFKRYDEDYTTYLEVALPLHDTAAK